MTTRRTKPTVRPNEPARTPGSLNAFGGSKSDEFNGVLALDDHEKLGPAEALLLEAADNRVAYHRTSADEVGAALLAQAREKLPEPERGTGGELIQQRGASGYLYNTLDHSDFIAAEAPKGLGSPGRAR